MTTVYLAGGMRGDWRKQIIAQFSTAEFIDPTTSGETHENDYTEWDLAAIDRSDIVFAYMEEGNPSGYGVCVEIGYAYKKMMANYPGRSKMILFCDERSPTDSRFKSYMGMCRAMASADSNKLTEGLITLEVVLNYLRRLKETE